MESSFLTQLKGFLKNKKNRRVYLTVFLCLAVAVAAGTVIALRINGHAMNYTQKILSCPLEVHEHTQSCMNDAGELVCGYADYVVHTHNADCYDPEGVLVCPLPEVEEHTHTESCWTEEKTLICGQEETPGHVHTEECYTTQQGELTCTLEEHTHGEECYDEAGELTCELEEHTHGEECYATQQVLTCEIAEGEGAHTHTDSCYETERVLSCGKLELHTHTESCFTTDESGNKQLTCGQIELQKHVHESECFHIVELTPEEVAAMNSDAAEDDEADPTSSVSGEIAGTGVIEGPVSSDESSEPSETTSSEEPDDGISSEEPDDGVSSEEPDDGTSSEEPDDGISSEEPDDGTSSVEPDDGTSSEVTSGEEPAGEEPVGELTMTYTDDNVTVTATYGAEANIPEEARLQVYAITPESDPEHYEERVDEAISAAGIDKDATDISPMVLNIGFFLPDGTEVEPAAPVALTVQFLQNGIPEGAPVKIVHFGDDGTQTYETSQTDEGASFEVDGFSDFAFILEVIDENGPIAGETAGEVKHAQVSGLVGEDNDLQLRLGSLCKYEFTIGVGNQPWTLDLPSTMSWEAGTTEVKTTVTVENDKGEPVTKEVTMGTIAITTDGKVTYTPTSDCPDEAVKDVTVSTNFTVSNTLRAGLSLPGIPQNIKFEPRKLDDYRVNAKLSQNGVELGADDKVVVGEHYMYHVDFAENAADGEFSTPMFFDLPEGVKCKPVQDQPVYDSDNKQVGTYSIDENGRVTVEFYDEYLSGNENLTLSMDFDLVVAEGSNNTLEFPWGHNGETKTFTVDSQPDATLTKVRPDGDEKAYNPKDPEGPSIKYKVELEITKGMVLNPELKDVMEPGLSYREGSGKITVTDDKGNDVTKEMNPPLTLEQTDYGWVVENMPEPLSKGWKVTVEYLADVDPSVAGDSAVKGNSFNFTAENTAVFDGEAPTTGDREPFHREDNDKYSFNEERLDKSGSKVEGENQLNWEIVVGSGSTDVRGTVVSDKLEGKHWIDESKPLVLKWKDETGTNVREVKIEWNSDDPNLTVHRDGNNHITSFEYKIPEPDTSDSEDPFWKGTKNGEDCGWGPGHTVKLEYSTTYDDPDPDNPFENTATVDADKGKYEDTGTIGVGAGTISKNGQLSADGEYMEYAVQLSIPSAADLAEATGGMACDGKFSRFYISDELAFEDVKIEDENGSRTVRYFVENIPEDVEITVTTKSGKEIRLTRNWDGIPGVNEFYVALGGVDFTHSDEDPNKKTIREFRIWFNRHVREKPLEKLTKDDTYWLLDEPCTITMTYRVKTSAKTYVEDTQYSGNIYDCDLTLKDLLNQGRTLKNQAIGHGRSSNSFKSTHKYKGSLPEYDVQKDGKILTDPEHPFNSEIEYRVQFNAFGAMDQSNGEYEKVEIDPDTFYFEDIFDSRLEYVPESLQIEVYAPNSHRHRYTFQYVGDPETVTIGAVTKLTAQATGFNKRTHQGTTGDDEETLWDYMKSKSKGPRKIDALYVFVYKLRVKEQYITGEPLELHNEATVYYNDKHNGDDATVNFTPDALIKDGEHIVEGGLDIVRYTVEVNPGAADMVTTDNDNANPVRFTLTDEMDDKLELNMDSIKVYAVAGEKEIPLDRVTDQSLVRPGSHKFVVQETEGNAFKLILPDETHLKIVYDTYVNVDLGTTGVTVSNTIKMEGGLELSAASEAKFDMDGSSARSTGDTKMKLYKKDASTGNFIDGAEFELYTIAEGGTVKATINDTEYSFTKHAALTPTALKPATVTPDSNNKEGYYLLLETQAPGGYQRIEEPLVVKFGEKPEDEPSTVTLTYNDVTYENVTVHYITNSNNVIIVDNTPEAYELPRTGGTGTLLMMGGAALLLMGAVGMVLLGRRRRRA